MHKMKVIDPTGDAVITWTVEDEVKMEAASAAFERLVREGYTAYAFPKEGQPGEMVEIFNPAHEKIIMAPRMAGG